MGSNGKQGGGKSAVAYLRTSSASSVGEDKDSHVRQSEAIGGFARRAGMEVVATYYDAAVSGADPIEFRPGFSALLDHIEGNGVLALGALSASPIQAGPVSAGTACASQSTAA